MLITQRHPDEVVDFKWLSKEEIEQYIESEKRGRSVETDII